MAKTLDPGEVERLAGEGLAGYQVAQALGVSYDTLARRLADTPEIAEALKRGQQLAIGKVENALYESAIKGNLGAQCFFLKNRAPERWKERTEVEQIVRNAPIKELPDDELQRVIEEG